MKSSHKAQLLQKRKWRIRKKVNGTAARPRLSVKFSGKHIYAQAINDEAGATLLFVSTLGADSRKANLKGNVGGAKSLGETFAAQAKAAGITSVVFDRNGRLFHGRVKTFAEAAREGGLQF